MKNGNQDSESSQKEKVKNGTEVSQNLLHDEVVEALSEEARKRGLKECKLDISSGSSKGDNFMGIVAKVKVTGINSEGREVQWNWIAKAAPQTDIYRNLLKIDIAYNREVYMYKLFNTFDEFQEEKNLQNPFNSHPKFVLSYLKPYKESFVMEDLKAEGYIMRDRQVPLDVNHVKLVMKEYGKLHAVSFALRDQKPKLFERIAKETEDKYFVPDDSTNASGLDEMFKYQDAFNNKVRDTLNDETDADVIESWKLFSANAIHNHIEAVRTTSQYSVIGHGDSWTNNMLWRYENSANPEIPSRVCLLDWQLARYGSPALDLSYFIYACTDQKFREEYYDKMIKLYYYSLCAHLAELGSDPEKLFPYSALEAELKRHCVFGFYMATMVLQLMTSDSSEIPEWTKSENVDEFMNAFDYKSVNYNLFKERLRGVVLHMHQKGYFEFFRQKY